ncbi:chloride channel protein [Paenibacillus silvisoli]|uniref:chloride channel protein n=1 Tax=Paenibacillus silvisoli TaxID=3110539 RepID=UPI002805D3C9|nr:chloride channel protein [Paenibacillus silvisoli]
MPEELLRDFRITPRSIFICSVALIVGVAGALIAIALTRMIGFFTNLFFYHELSAAFRSPYPNQLGPRVMLVPITSAFIIGLMARYGSDKIRGHGIPEAMEAILVGKSIVSPKLALLKPLSAAISIGSGGPFGAEGPIIMSGSAFGSMIGQLLYLTAAERKVLLLCGAAAGMSATFHAPLASVLFAVELLAFEFRLRSLVPIALASGVADLARTMMIDGKAVFPSSVVPASHTTILFLAIGFGIGGSMIAYLLTKAIYGVEDLFEKLPIHWMWWPAIGAVAIGVGGYWIPQVLGVGYDTIGQLTAGQFFFKLALVFLLVKAAIWIIALGSGTSGGILAPLLIIGGTLGSWLATVFHSPTPGVWAILGMAALFAGVTRSPLTTVVFLLELTHDMEMMIPTLIACAVAAAVSALLLPRSILTEKISRRGRHIARDYEVHPLDLQRVSPFMASPIVCFRSTETIGAANRMLSEQPLVYRFREYPVIAENGRFLGMVSRTELESLGQLSENQHRVVGDYARSCMQAAHNATILSVMHTMLEMNVNRMIVLDQEAKPIGIVTKQSILDAGKHAVEEESRRERILFLPRKTKVLQNLGERVLDD